MDIQQQIENMIENHNVTSFDYKGFDSLASQLSDVELDKQFIELFWKCALKFKYTTNETNKGVELEVTFFDHADNLTNKVKTVHHTLHDALQNIRALRMQ